MFLSGAWKRETAHLFVDGTLGLLCQPGSGYKPERAKVWAADNGCYGKYVGDAKWLAWLKKHAGLAGSCLFATAPDVLDWHAERSGGNSWVTHIRWVGVGNAAATLERSAPFLPIIRQMGYKAALVAQDGLEYLDVPWDEFDVLFIGGSTEWKLSPAAAELLVEAKRRGKGTHVGRVGYGKRIAYCRGLDCVDSIDSTRLAYGTDVHLQPLLNAMAEQQTQGVLL